MKNTVKKILERRELGLLKASKEIGISYNTLRKYIKTNKIPRTTILNKISLWINHSNQSSLEKIPSPRKKVREESIDLRGKNVKEIIIKIIF